MAEQEQGVEHRCGICGEHHHDSQTWVIENGDGKFVACFSTHLLAHYFVEDGSGCYRYRDAPPVASSQCPICGVDTPHQHGADEVMEWRNPTPTPDAVNAEKALDWRKDDCRAVGDWSADAVEQLVFELSVELEEASLNATDYVTVNQQKLTTIAQRVLARLTTPKPVEEPEKGAAGLINELSRLDSLATAGPWVVDSGDSDTLGIFREADGDELGYMATCEGGRLRPLPQDILAGRPHRKFTRHIEHDANTRLLVLLRNNLSTIIAALAATNAEQVEVWQPIESAPYAMHVLAARFDDEAGEWIVHVAMSPPSKPFTHWRVLPALPDGSGPVTALKANGDAS